jgi:hypothetical protein
MVADSASGNGSITLLDLGVYRGEGIYFGWSQEELAAEYERLHPPPDERHFDLPQLG